MTSDETLLQIVDKALAEAAARSGSWLVCRAGCWQCCVGAFAINALDAARLRAGLSALRQADPDKAERIDARVRAYVARVSGEFPGDPATGAIGEDAASQAAFEGFANYEVCPVLDPSSGTCDLYAARPMTCRIFGPPVRNEEGLGVCELCYQGASPEEIAACEMIPDPDHLEEELLRGSETGQATPASTIVAFALASNAQGLTKR
jgi:Fe-S-cluster containining protein